MSSIHLDEELFSSPTACAKWNYLNSTIEKPKFMYGDEIKINDYVVVTKDNWSNESSWINNINSPTVYQTAVALKFEYIGDETDEDKIRAIIDENVKYIHCSYKYLSPTGWMNGQIAATNILKVSHYNPKVAYVLIDYSKTYDKDALINSNTHWLRFAKTEYGSVLKVTMEQRAVNWISWFNREWIVKLFNKLETITSTQTITLGSTLLAKLTDEDKKIATDKGWTLA